MSATTEFLLKHGVPFLFAAVFLEQLGLPLPSLPWLLVAGALTADGKFNPLLGIAATVVACLMADGLWFNLGRHHGSQVMRFLCRISLEPDSCVRRTQNLFTRFGMRGVIVAKFVPGLNTMAPPLAGMSGVGAGRFFLFDGIGSLLYGSCFLGLGFLFSNQIEQIAAALAQIGGGAAGLIAGLAAFYLGAKYWRRRRVLHELHMARITVDELHQKQAAGESLVILDLRSAAELAQDPSLILGALHFGMDEVESRHREIPRDRDVIVYCSCPNEVTSARVALLLRKKGFTRVRPLLGGIDAWRKVNYPMAATAEAANAAKVGAE
jgi:membrane protein DedA with SNARE-associated domain/rhodanese-related sulfurtransferase